jgi:FAD/FMN-containing dehydrogenase
MVFDAELEDSTSPRREFLRRAGQAVVAGVVLGASVAAADESTPLRRAAKVLANRVRGSVVVRGTPEYEPWRQSMVWNYRKFRRFPDVIVQAIDDDDVVAAVQFARQQRIKITTRSGGHSWSGCFLRDGGVLVDLSRMQSIDVDVARSEARVQPGVIGRALNAHLARSGLAFPTAHCGMVPISGFLMGGGLGLNSVAWGGMSVFNIRAIDLVTAQGEKLHASPEQNADYYWAARGGGPGLFFTVTCFYLHCYPLPRAITTDTYLLPYGELVGLAQAMNDLGPRIDQSVELLAVVIPAPLGLAANCAPDPCRQIAVLSANAFGDTEKQSRAMLATLARHPLLRKPLQKIAGRATPFEVLYQDNEGPFPQRRARADNIYVDRVVEATQVLSRHMPISPAPGNTPVILWRGTDPYPDAAYTARGRFYFAAYAQWDDPADDLLNEGWLKDLYDELEPLATGHYINEFDRETRADRTNQCYSAANWQRLSDLRRRYDPDGVYQTFLGLSS